MTETSRLDAIQQRAYAIWEAAGRPHGQDREHWLRAEGEIAEMPAPPNGTRRPRAKAGARPAANRTRKAS